LKEGSFCKAPRRCIRERGVADTLKVLLGLSLCKAPRFGAFGAGAIKVESCYIKRIQVLVGFWLINSAALWCISVRLPHRILKYYPRMDVVISPASYLAEAQTEDALAIRMHELCAKATFTDGANSKARTLRRIEVGPSTRDVVWPMAFEELQRQQDEGSSRESAMGNYAYFMDKIHSRMFVDADDSVHNSYKCAWFTDKCASLEEPSVVHDGALGLVVDDALGYHAIHFRKGICVTRSLSIVYERPVPLGQVVILRTWTSRIDKSKTFLDGDVVDAADHSIRYARMSGLFFRMPENVIKWAAGNHLTADEFEARLLEATQRWEQGMPVRRIVSQPNPVDFPQLRVHNSHGVDVPLISDTDLAKFASSVPFEFVPPNRAIKLEIFRTAMTIEGLCFFSNYAMGPKSAHGGSILTCFAQFFNTAIHVLYGRDQYQMAQLTISYEKQTPLEAVALLTNLKITSSPSSSHRSGDDWVIATVNIESEDTSKKLVFARAQARFERREKTMLSIRNSSAL